MIAQLCETLDKLPLRIALGESPGRTEIINCGTENRGAIDASVIAFAAEEKSRGGVREYSVFALRCKNTVAIISLDSSFADVSRRRLGPFGGS